VEDVANLENDKYGKHEKYGEFLQKKVYGMNSVEVHVDIKRADIKKPLIRAVFRIRQRLCFSNDDHFNRSGYIRMKL
jgi:aspartyl/asparaginyl-tRNA synthetase